MNPVRKATLILPEDELFVVARLPTYVFSILLEIKRVKKMAFLPLVRLSQ